MTRRHEHPEQLELGAPAARRRHHRVADTSQQAAARAETETEALRANILVALQRLREATADEIHREIAANVAELNDVRQLMRVRRRVSDLRGRDAIADTGKRRLNGDGNLAIVWTLAPGVSGSPGVAHGAA